MNKPEFTGDKPKDGENEKESSIDRNTYLNLLHNKLVMNQQLKELEYQAVIYSTELKEILLEKNATLFPIRYSTHPHNEPVLKLLSKIIIELEIENHLGINEVTEIYKCLGRIVYLDNGQIIRAIVISLLPNQES